MQKGKKEGLLIYYCPYLTNKVKERKKKIRLKKRQKRGKKGIVSRIQSEREKKVNL